MHVEQNIKTLLMLKEAWKEILKKEPIGSLKNGTRSFFSIPNNEKLYFPIIGYRFVVEVFNKSNSEFGNVCYFGNSLEEISDISNLIDLYNLRIIVEIHQILLDFNCSSKPKKEKTVYASWLPLV